MAGAKRKRKKKATPAVDIGAVAGDNPYLAGLLTMFLGESDIESFDDAAYRLNLKYIFEQMAGKGHEGDHKTRTWFDALMQRSVDHYDDVSTIRTQTLQWGSILGTYLISRLMTHGEQATDKLLNLSEESALFAKGGGLDKVVQGAAKESAKIVLASLAEMGKVAKAGIEKE